MNTENPYYHLELRNRAGQRYRGPLLQIAVARVLVLVAVVMLVWCFTPPRFGVAFIGLVIFYALIEGMLIEVKQKGVRRAAEEMLRNSAMENERIRIARE